MSDLITSNGLVTLTQLSTDSDDLHLEFIGNTLVSQESNINPIINNVTVTYSSNTNLGQLQNSDCNNIGIIEPEDSLTILEGGATNDLHTLYSSNTSNTIYKGQPGDEGDTPYIGENGNWFIGDTDTGVKAKGTSGVYIGSSEPEDEDINIWIDTSSTVPIYTKIFKCTPNSTTFDAITTALNDSKLPIALDGSLAFVYQYTKNSSEHIFTIAFASSNSEALNEFPFIASYKVRKNNEGLTTWNLYGNNIVTLLQLNHGLVTRIGTNTVGSATNPVFLTAGYPVAGAPIPTKTSLLANDSNFITDAKVFFITYGVTTAADIMAAVEAGKVVLCYLKNKEFDDISGLLIDSDYSRLYYISGINNSNIFFSALNRSVQDIYFRVNRTTNQYSVGYGILSATTMDLVDGSVKKLTTETIGSATKPIYLLNGVPTECNAYPTVPTKTSQLTNDSGFLTETISDLFWCTFGSTTYSEITAALEANKLPILIRSGYVHIYIRSSDSGGHVFSRIGLNSGKQHVLYCDQSDDWSGGNTAYLTSSAASDGTIKKLGTDTVGSSSTPIYLSNGVPTECDTYPTIPTKTSDLTNDSGFLTEVPSEHIQFPYESVTFNTILEAYLDNKQISIKTLDGIILYLVFGHPSDTNCFFFSSVFYGLTEYEKIGYYVATIYSSKRILEHRIIASADQLVDGSVTKLGKIDVGDTNTPIYLNKGVPTPCTILGDINAALEYVLDGGTE